VGPCCDRCYGARSKHLSAKAGVKKIGHPLLGIDMFSMGSDPRMYNESLFAGRTDRLVELGRVLVSRLGSPR
jgi:hypothetical protein